MSTEVATAALAIASIYFQSDLIGFGLNYFFDLVVKVLNVLRQIYESKIRFLPPWGFSSTCVGNNSNDGGNQGDGTSPSGYRLSETPPLVITEKFSSISSSNHSNNSSKQRAGLEELEPAFLNEQDYPESWLVYDTKRRCVVKYSSYKEEVSVDSCTGGIDNDTADSIEEQRTEEINENKLYKVAAIQ